MAVMTYFHVGEVLFCHLVSENKVSATRICNTARHFLICSTFVLVDPFFTNVDWNLDTFSDCKGCDIVWLC